MKLRIATLVLGLMLSNILFADGPPVDSTGKFRSKYIAIKLEANQVNHLQVCRWLKLTAAQRKRVHFLNLPEYIDITDPFYRDCICGMVYAMWFRVDSIAFQIRDTTKMIRYEPEDSICTRYGKGFDKGFRKDAIFIGTTGQLFYMGKLIKLEEVAGIIKEYKPEEGNDKYFLFEQPPITGNPDAKEVIRIKNRLRNSKFEGCQIIWG